MPLTPEVCIILPASLYVYILIVKLLRKMDISYIIGDSRLTGMQYYVDIANAGTRPMHVIKCSCKGIQECILIKKTENHLNGCAIC